MKNILRLVRYCDFFFLVFFLFTSTDPLNAQWIQTNGPLTEVTYSLAVGINGASDSILYAGTYLGGVFLSTNYGDNWIEIDGGNFSTGDTGFTRRDIRALAAIRNGTGGISLFAGTDGSGVFFSQNADTIWTPVNTGLTNKSISALVINSNGKGDTNLYALTGNGVFLSTNKGVNWISTNTELRGYYGFVVGRKATGDTILFKLDGSGGVLRSTDNGGTWTASSNGLLSYATVTCLAVHDTIIYAGCSGYGVYYSLNGGIDWVSGGGIQYSQPMVTLAVGGRYLFAGVSSPSMSLRSVWRRPLSEMLTSVKDRYEQKPFNFTLEQNYPNPFNPTTNISFTLPTKDNITLKVFNLLGKEVATLFSGMASAGNHIVQFDASSFTSGIYFYRLRTEKFNETKKLILLK
jgi:hypothetical protein